MIHQLRFSGDPVLHKAALPCKGRDVGSLVTDMQTVCMLHQGVGIAAPQVGSGLRVFIAHLSSGSIVAIDPVLTCTGQLSVEPEGCLSLPGQGFLVSRHERAHLEASDLAGVRFTLDVAGFDARILQHEMDHIEGFLINDRAV
jgi:peptide deformylase